MALVYPNIKSPSERAYGTVNLSTEANGETNSDVLDMGGLSLAGIELSTVTGSSVCNYGFKGSPDTTAKMQTLLNSSGSPIIFGTTSITMLGRTMVFDPATFAGLRMIQLISMTTSAAAPQVTGATARLLLAPVGSIK
jgi:hypothetical protein